MNYEKPAVIDFGNLVELTESAGIIGGSDNTGFTIQGNIGPTNFSIAILP